MSKVEQDKYGMHHMHEIQLTFFFITIKKKLLDKQIKARQDKQQQFM